MATGLALAGVARCDEQDGLLAEALRRYEQVLVLRESAGEPAPVAAGAEGEARIATARGDSELASTLLTRALMVRSSGRRARSPLEAADLAPLEPLMQRTI